MQAVNDPDVVIISIATRPDCLQPEILSLLAEINEKKTVWVELGLQTIHDDTRAVSYTHLDVYKRQLSSKNCFTSLMLSQITAIQSSKNASASSKLSATFSSNN